MKNRQKIHGIAMGAIIATMYVVLTYIASALGLSSGVIQVRFSEALTILPIFTPYAIPGLFIGCLTANLLTGCAITDVIFGSLATLIGAICTRALKNHPVLATLPPIISNAVIIPFVLMYVYNCEGTYLYFLLTVAVGEIISCGVLGYVLQKSVKKSNLIANKETKRKNISK